jgi:sulfotransferase
MSNQIFFQSSLPRAGSTLLQNIMGQNPEFYVTPTSGVLELVYAARNNYTNSPEFKAQDQDLMKKGFLSFCRNGVEGFFHAITDKPYILDKSRGWGVHYGFLNSFYPNPKIICMVRDVRAVYSSMEKNFRKNPHKENGIQNVPQLVGTTLNKRIDIWASGMPVGVAIDRLQDVIQQNIADKMLFIRYEDLMDNPVDEMTRIYEYLGLPYYEEHDFENITQLTHEDDRVHGIYGDHQLRPKFERKPDDYMEVLGYEISMNIKNHYKWFYDYFGYV